MKILLTADPELPVPPVLYGGIERVVEVLVKEYVAQGHDVTLCAHADSRVPARLVAWKGRRSQQPADMLKNLVTLTTLVYRNSFDIIHSFSRLAYMAGVLPLSIPKIMSYQREPSLGQAQKASRLARKGSLVFTGCSNYISRQLSTVAEAYTIYNCAPVDKFRFTAAVAENAPLVFLGRIEDIKGTHVAIEVAEKAGRQLIIAGNIPEGKEYYFKEMVQPRLNDRISYIGPVNDDQKNDLLGKALAFLMPIQWNEPFGIVMAEAMACGTPVLGFAMGSIPEVIENGINGFVCKNVEEMVQRVADCALLDRKRMRKIAEERFSNSKISADYLDLYTKLIERSR
jgi:glycosyltransferase involved in cell wall biosynthesis